MRPAALVVGAGIAGLSSALSLARAGWSVTVLERAAHLAEVGAGFAMSRNAVAAFRALGFDDAAVGALGRPTWAAGTWDLHGHPILTITDDPATRRSVALIGVHRRRLHAALLRGSQSAGVQIVTDAPVTDVDAGDPGGAAAVVAGREVDLVVGADGMRSTVRSTLFPTHRAVYSGYSSWRAITADVRTPTALQQFWGPHAEFGTMPVSATETYWYGYVAMPERTVYEDELTAARERFTSWAEPVQQVLAATPTAAVMRHDVHHLAGALPRYTRGRVVMVGDAAHGFLPTMGQGAATALEDGLCVGLLVGAPVAAGGSLAAALDGFDAARRPRCAALGRASRASARIGAHLGPGVRQGVRNTVMRHLPAGAITRGAQAAMGWTPPEPAEPTVEGDRGRRPGR